MPKSEIGVPLSGFVYQPSVSGGNLELPSPIVTGKRSAATPQHSPRASSSAKLVSLAQLFCNTQRTQLSALRLETSRVLFLQLVISAVSSSPLQCQFSDVHQSRMICLFSFQAASFFWSLLQVFCCKFIACKSSSFVELCRESAFHVLESFERNILQESDADQLPWSSQYALDVTCLKIK